LFKKFETSENGSNLNPNGIGLGLYICKKVVKLCGGDISIAKSVQQVDDPINYGTKFVFTMSIDDVR